jgi:hypothetical protein
METEHRFSEHEVSLVLQRAAELEARDGVPADARGLTLRDLESVAAEVGIRPESLARAVAEIRSRSLTPGSSLAGPSPSQKAIRAVATEVSRDDLATLVQQVEDAVGKPGTVTEALGTVRWTSADRFLTTQVSIAAGSSETTITVHERFEDRIRPILHGVPTSWGAIIGMAVAGGIGLGTLPLVALIGAGAVAGLGAGRAVWTRLAKRSRDRVDRLANDLSEQAGRGDL